MCINFFKLIKKVTNEKEKTNKHNISNYNFLWEK